MSDWSRELAFDLGDVGSWVAVVESFRQRA